VSSHSYSPVKLHVDPEARLVEALYENLIVVLLTYLSAQLLTTYSAFLSRRQTSQTSSKMMKVIRWR